MKSKSPSPKSAKSARRRKSKSSQPTLPPASEITFDVVEAARAAYLAKQARIWRRSLIVIGVAALAALVIILTGDPSLIFSRILGAGLFIGVFGLLISAIILALATSKDATAYRRAYKAYFVERSLASTFTNLRYDHAAGLDRDLLRASGYIDTGDIYHSGDLVAGRYKDVSFVQADVHIQDQYTDSDGHTHTVTIFKGRFLLFEFPKKFDFRLELIGRRFKSAKVAKKTTSGRKMRRLSTESPDFNRTFKIYAEDGFEAYYLLDPAYIGRIQSIADHYRGNLFLGFLDRTLMIGLNDGSDSFEPPKPKHPLDEQAELARVTSDIKVITDLVDLLRLER